MDNRYQVMYRPTLLLSVNGTNYTISPSDIVSISIMHNYDTMTFPIIRIRLFPDLQLLQNILEYPDEIEMVGDLYANTYLLQDESKPSIVDGAANLRFQLKVYIENKNIPSSVMDQYRDGIKIKDDMNQQPKVPVTLYGYHQSMIYYMKRQCESIYKDMALPSVIQDILSRGSIHNYQMDPLDQQSRFDQILIPNLNVIQTLAFFDTYYGMYRKGCHVYGDLDQLYITSADSYNIGNLIPVVIADYKNNTDMVGLKKINNAYSIYVLSQNVSVLSETDIERILQAKHIAAVNVNDNTIETADLQELYEYKPKEIYGDSNIPNILHKYQNPFIASSNAARIKEKTTRVDLSMVGADIATMHVNSRFSLIFESQVRGRNMSGSYRPSYINHVLSNQDNNLFVAQTTMQLCKN